MCVRGTCAGRLGKAPELNIDESMPLRCDGRVELGDSSWGEFNGKEAVET